MEATVWKYIGNHWVKAWQFVQVYKADPFRFCPISGVKWDENGRFIAQNIWFHDCRVKEKLWKQKGSEQKSTAFVLILQHKINKFAEDAV
jgi:hypothetical protein